MTQYLISVHHAEAGPDLTDEQMQAAFKAVDVFNEELQADGSWVFAGGLQPPDTATVVDGTGAQPMVTDGPFAETKEQLGGFWVVGAADLDAALAIAARGSKARAVAVEVRPLQEEPA